MYCGSQLPFLFSFLPRLNFIIAVGPKKIRTKLFLSYRCQLLEVLMRRTKTAQTENSNRIGIFFFIDVKRMEFFHIALGGSYTNKCMKKIGFAGNTAMYIMVCHAMPGM